MGIQFNPLPLLKSTSSTILSSTFTIWHPVINQAHEKHSQLLAEYRGHSLMWRMMQIWCNYLSFSTKDVNKKHTFQMQYIHKTKIISKRVEILWRWIICVKAQKCSLLRQHYFDLLSGSSKSLKFSAFWDGAGQIIKYSLGGVREIFVRSGYLWDMVNWHRGGDEVNIDQPRSYWMTWWLTDYLFAVFMEINSSSNNIGKHLYLAVVNWGE